MKSTLAISTAALVLLAACGGSDDAAPTDSTPVETPTSDVSVDTEAPAETEDGATEKVRVEAVDDDTIEILGIYGIDDDDQLIGDVPEDQAAVFARFSELIPAEARPEVQLFVAIDQEASDGTDGAMQTDPNDPTFYYIALDTSGSSTELDRTMIHEFGHLLTNGPVQTDLDMVEDDCPLYFQQPGCIEPGDYLYDFVVAFYPEGTSISDEFDYEADPESFITDYAATNPGEDIAEIFAEWVLRDDISDTEGVVFDKLSFFEDYPEIVALRDEIRARL